MALVGKDHLYDKVELAGAGVDPATGTLTTESKVSDLTDQGRIFHMSSKVTGILNEGLASILIITPPTKELHLIKVRANAGRGDIDMHAYEDTDSTGGVLIPTHSTNRTIAATPETLIYGAPVITTPGLDLHSLWLPPTGTGTGQSANGVRDAGAGEEWVMKPNSKYLWQLTNNSGVTVDAWFEFLWYEKVPT